MMWWLLLSLGYMCVGVTWASVAYIMDDGYQDDNEIFLNLFAWPVVWGGILLFMIVALVRKTGDRMVGRG